MRLPKLSLSILFLIAANLAPLSGVLFFGWNAVVIMLLYWTENLVLGFYSILKMAMVKVPHPAANLGKLLLIPFFCLHFGGFCAGHGLFLIALGSSTDSMSSFLGELGWPGPLIFLQLLISVISYLWHNKPAGMEWPVFGLFISHGVSFVQNYLGKKEYTSVSLQKLMGQPYKRIVILHVAIIAGAVPIMMFGSPVPLLCILVLLKLAGDIYLHLREHRAAKVDGSAESNTHGAVPSDWSARPQERSATTMEWP